MKGIRAAAAAIAVVGLIAGCSSGSSTEDANAEYCAALSDLSDQLATLSQDLSSDSTMEELRSEGEDIRQSAQVLEEAGDDVDQAVASEISQAQDVFEAALADIPGDATIGEAASAYQLAADDYLVAIRSALDEVGCT